MGVYDDLDNDTLREQCKARGLPSYGNKATLAARLTEDDAKKETAVQPQPDPTPVDQPQAPAPPEDPADIDSRPLADDAPEDPNAPRLVAPGLFQIGYILGDWDDDQHQALLGETALQAQVAGHHVKGGARLVSLTGNGDGTKTARYEVIVRRDPP